MKAWILTVDDKPATHAKLDERGEFFIKKTGLKCLLKPISVVELLKAVDEALAGVKGDRAKRGAVGGARLGGPGRFIIPAVLFFFLFSISHNPSTGTLKGSEGCKGCHRETYTEAMAKPYRHSVVDEKCAVCHIMDDPVKEEREMSSAGYQMGFLFVLRDLLKDASYRVKVFTHDRYGKGPQPLVLNFSPGEVNDYAEDTPGGPLFRPAHPAINEVKLEEVKRGVFAEATVSWTTDVHTNSVAEYGLTNEYGERTSSGASYALEHRATLVGLGHGKSYHYRVVARDILGNVARSKDHILDTAFAFGQGKRGDEDKSVPVLDGVKVLKTKDGLLLFQGSASKPSRVVLRVQELRKGDEKHGPGFFPERYSKIEVCVRCHPQGISHPVGVSARGPDVRDPENLPTLPGGVLTCVTCHFPHGGGKEYFARMDIQRDICIDCHIKYR
jgi:predicted CXXCH cytochrome family protein